MNRLFSIFICVLAIGASVCAFPSVTKIGDTVVDPNAMTLINGAFGNAINGLSFQQDAVVTHNGWQYVSYYNYAGYVCVARRHLPSGSWAIIELTDYIFTGDNDAHNIISMGICPNDGTIHLSFDHHGHDLNYRVSDLNVATDPNGITWSTSLFGPVVDYLISAKITGVTYPRFWQTPDRNLQFGFRRGGSGSGDWYITDYSGIAHSWSNYRQVINRSGSYTDTCGTSTSRNAYLNYPGYGPDGTLHLTWTWREGSGGTNHDICYAYSPDDGVTWYNNAPPLEGIKIHTVGEIQTQALLNLLWTFSGPEVIGDTSTQQWINVDSSNIVAIAIDRQYSLMNQQSQAIDAQGCVHTVMWYATDGATCNVFSTTGANYHHYWRDIVGTWHHSILPGGVGGRSRPKLFIRDNGDAFLIHGSAGGDLVIQTATSAAQWMDWQVVYTETGSFLGEALGDFYRFKDGILSVMMQESPAIEGDPSPLRILDFQLNN